MKFKKLLAMTAIAAMTATSAAPALPVMAAQPAVTAQAVKAKISSKSTLLLVGGKQTLKVTGAKGKITWKSSNAKIASVSQKGVVKAKKKGSATVTAKVGKKSYKCKVKVFAEKVSWDYGEYGKKIKPGSTQTIQVGESGVSQLNFSFDDAMLFDESARFKSSDPSVLEVDNIGTLEAKQVGKKVKVTATVGGKNFTFYFKTIEPQPFDDEDEID